MTDMEERTLSDIICDNTIIEKVQARALEIPNPVTNPIRVCQRRRETGNQHEHVTSGPINEQQQTVSPNFVETTQTPVPINIQQRVPKSLAPPPPSLFISNTTGEVSSAVSSASAAGNLQKVFEQYVEKQKPSSTDS